MHIQQKNIHHIATLNMGSLTKTSLYFISSIRYVIKIIGSKINPNKNIQAPNIAIIIVSLIFTYFLPNHKIHL